MKQKLMLFILGIVIFSGFTGCASIIRSGNKGLIWRPLSSGLDRNKVYDDGITWHWFWNNVIEYDIQWKSYREKIELLTADDLHIEVTVTIVLRPVQAELPQLELEVGPDYYVKLVKPELFSIVKSNLANYLHNELPEKSPQMEKEIFSAMKERLKGKHLEIDNVAIEHFDYSKIVTEAVDRKLAAKHRLGEKEFDIQIAEKDAEIQRTRARGQKDAQKIIDEGLTKKYLQFKALEVQERLSTSPNAKFYFVPLGKDGLPVIVGTDER